MVREGVQGGDQQRARGDEGPTAVGALQQGNAARASASFVESLAYYQDVDVLRLVAQGLTNAQIAERLIVSPRTVNAHLHAIYRKIGASSRSAATRFAIEQSLA
jgi:DNA-binding NarL/FixJ family response regulator